MSNYPKWATTPRQSKLVELFVSSKGFCVYGLSPCAGKETQEVITACAWGRNCTKPMADGQLCRYKPEPDKPHLPCLYVTYTRKRWHCAYGDYPCYKPFGSFFENYTDTLVADWKATDREQRLIDWQLEQNALHQTGERNLPIRGQFSGIAKDIYLDKQPQYYIIGFGINCLTLKPFAKVRLASSFWILWIELEKLTYARLGKSKKRKAIRYHKRIDEIDKAVILAVRYCLAE